MIPLATVVLYLRESDWAQLLRTQKGMRASELDSEEFWRDRASSTFGRHLDCVQVTIPYIGFLLLLHHTRLVVVFWLLFRM